MPLLKDSFSLARGGHSRMLEIGCRSCEAHLCFYQKDGPGPLRRMYIDRISGSPWSDLTSKECQQLRILRCPNCDKMIGTCYIYEKEQRPAIILYQDAVVKKRVKAKKV